MNKYTITIRENNPLDGELLEVLEFSAPALSHKWIKTLLLGVDTWLKRAVFAEIERNGEYIGSINRYSYNCFTMLCIHLNGKHYVKITDKEVLRNA